MAARRGGGAPKGPYETSRRCTLAVGRNAAAPLYYYRAPTFGRGKTTGAFTCPVSTTVESGSNRDIRLSNEVTMC